MSAVINANRSLSQKHALSFQLNSVPRHPNYNWYEEQDWDDFADQWDPLDSE